MRVTSEIDEIVNLYRFGEVVKIGDIIGFAKLHMFGKVDKIDKISKNYKKKGEIDTIGRIKKILKLISKILNINKLYKRIQIDQD